MISQEIGYRLQFLTVGVDREIPNLLIAKLVIKLDRTSFFVVAEEVLKSDTNLSRRTARLECAFEEIL